jgi:hypothetical protein
VVERGPGENTISTRADRMIAIEGEDGRIAPRVEIDAKRFGDPA